MLYRVFRRHHLMTLWHAMAFVQWGKAKDPALTVRIQTSGGGAVEKRNHSQVTLNGWPWNKVGKFSFSHLNPIKSVNPSFSNHDELSRKKKGHVMSKKHKTSRNVKCYLMDWKHALRLSSIELTWFDFVSANDGLFMPAPFFLRNS